MKIFPSTRFGQISLIAAPLVVAAVFVVIYFLPDKQNNPVVPAPPNPQVLSESSIPLRLDPPVVKAVNPPKQVKLLNVESVQAKSFLVYDVASGATLANRNEDFPLPIASLTKLMTAYVVYQEVDLTDEIITIAAGDTMDISPVLGLRAGDQIKAIDLFNSMLIGSANDAGLTLGNFVSRKMNLPFKDLMNQAATKLGMENSHFSNAIGFDSETNYSTASDLKRLVSAVQLYQEFADVGRKTSYSFVSEVGNNYSIRTTNKLIATDSEISSIKTGFTEEAQGAMITQINHQGQKFVIILLGSPNREQDTLKLKSAVIGAYRWQ